MLAPSPDVGGHNVGEAPRPSRRTRRRQRNRLEALRREQAKLPRVDVIFNPVSGHGDPMKDRNEIEKVLSDGYHSVRIHETSVEVDASTLAKLALEDGASVVVASGGDGTVTAVAKAVRDFSAGETGERSDNLGGHGAGTDAEGAGIFAGSVGSVGNGPLEDTDSAPMSGESTAAKDEDVKYTEPPRLGVIPRGTANAFCAAVGIPFDLKKAARLVNRATARRLDLANVNGDEPMLLLCGIGLEAETVKRADRELKNRWGTAAYFFAGLASVFRQNRFRVTMVLHDVRQRTRVGSKRGADLESDFARLSCVEVEAVTIANSAPPTSVLAQGIGDVRPDDGMLEVVCVSPQGGVGSTIVSMLSMLKSALLRTTGVARPDVYGLRARRVEIVCDPPQRVVVDGEDGGMTPVIVELDADAKKRQLHVIAPKASQVTRQRRKLSRALVRTFRNARGLGVLLGIVWGLRKVKSSRGSDWDSNDS